MSINGDAFYRDRPNNYGPSAVVSVWWEDICTFSLMPYNQKRMKDKDRQLGGVGN